MCMGDRMQIKAWYGDWKEADFEAALRLFRHLMRIWVPENFNNHFKGITYEELAAGRQCNC